MRRRGPNYFLPEVVTRSRNYYASVYRPDMTTIVVVGNVDPQKAADVITKYFGGWTASGSKPAVDLPPVPNNAAASATSTV
ncbi:MAG: insulinase family protein [Candidatus Cybelea sp.]